MTATTDEKSAATTAARPSRTGRDGAVAVPPPPRTRRRPLLVIIGALLCVLAMLGGVLALRSAQSTTSVIVTRTDIPRGAVVDAQDLTTTQVHVGPEVRTIAAADMGEVIGQRAAVELPAGTLLSSEALTDTLPPAQGHTLVGLAVTPAQRPAQPLTAGDLVRAVITAPTTAAAAGTTAAADPATVDPVAPVPAQVVDVREVPDGGGLVVVDVTVPADQAAVLAQASAAGQVAIVLDAREQ